MIITICIIAWLFVGGLSMIAGCKYLDNNLFGLTYKELIAGAIMGGVVLVLFLVALIIDSGIFKSIDELFNKPVFKDKSK